MWPAFLLKKSKKPWRMAFEERSVIEVGVYLIAGFHWNIGGACSLRRQRASVLQGGGWQASMEANWDTGRPVGYTVAFALAR
mgnify:CR=1 FL=1